MTPIEKAINEIDKVIQVSQAYNFAKQYYNSPGFNERFKKVPEYIEQYNNDLTYDREEVNPPQIKRQPFDVKTGYRKEDESDYFRDENGRKVTIGTHTFKPYWTSTMLPWVYPFFDYESTASHEYGHAIEDSVELKHKPEGSTEYIPDYIEYSQIFPHLRNSKSYKRELKRHWADRDKYEQDPHSERYYNANPDAHDGAPTDSYADLMAFREALYRYNIYDSTKANNPFTKEHLKKWKSLHKPLRLFNNFTDDQIVQMMNDIAQNNTSSTNLTYYAKSGTKLIPRKFKFIK